MKQSIGFGLQNRGIALTILLALSLAISCSNPEQATNTCNWSLNNLEMILPGGAIQQRYSVLANKLAFIDNSGVGIIDMMTGAQTEVNLARMNIGLGDSLVPWFIDAVDWSPYDKTLLVVMQLGAINDTVNPWRTGMLFLHNDGSFDTLFIAALSEHVQYLGWLNDSRPGSDSLCFEEVPKGAGGLDSFAVFANYCPESGLFVARRSQPSTRLIRQSFDGKHTLDFQWNGDSLGVYAFDNKTIDWGNLKPYTIGSVSFSPDEKHIVVEDRFGGGGVEWIYNVSDFLSGQPVSPIFQLNFVKMYCLGSILGGWGEFVSDSSLVVSLHGDPATGAQCNLYEVDFNGDIIRKLTSY